MAAAWALTLLALCGVAIGVSLGQRRLLSAHLSGAGGGLLLGIALFWLMPEIAEASGWAIAAGFTTAAFCAVGLLDRVLLHAGHSPREGIMGPLFVATAVHSFFDGWSVRMLTSQALAGVAAPIGLALHKIPEGLALGWIARRSMKSLRMALAVSAAVELVTLAGAFVEPAANRSGIAAFGNWWTAAVLAVIAGTFLFLGFHTVFPNRRNAGVVGVFFVALVATAAASLA
ncbi:MAG: ZIP family metal transporter [Bryobacteraceae bacterium]